MNGMDRLYTIKQILINEKKVNVSDLSKKFSVTEETIRRDLEKLENEGFATRTYGGAVLNNEEPVSNIPFYKRADHNLQAKQQIAVLAKGILQNLTTISADSSTTVMETLKLLKNRSDLTIVTNSTEVLKELILSEVTVISTGGIFNKQSLSLQGVLAEAALTTYHVDAALISCKGVDQELGITDSNEIEARLKKNMLDQADKVILLVDSSKFGRKAFVHLCNISKISIIITDQEPSIEWKQYLEKKGIQLIF